MGQFVSYPRTIRIEIQPTYNRGKKPNDKELEKFIKTKKWKTEVKYSTPDGFKANQMTIQKGKILLQGTVINKKFSEEYIKDGFHKATHAGDHLMVNGHVIYIKFKNIKIKYSK